MTKLIPLFDLSPSLDRRKLAEHFAKQRRVQIPDFLTRESALTIHRILSRETPWGLAWQAGTDGPHHLKQQQLRALTPAERQGIARKVEAACNRRDYAFLYAQYPMLDAYLQKWAEGSPHDLLLEHVNDDPLMNLVREITGLPELLKADAQATLYGPGHFLASHDDSHKEEGWRVAYVMNFCAEVWRPEWGGYLMFHDKEGDLVSGFKPRFNALNLFLVPQSHSVSFVPSFAPVARFAITGWFRDS